MLVEDALLEMSGDEMTSKVGIRRVVWESAVDMLRTLTTSTRFIFYNNHVYKNVKAQKYSFFKNIVVILLVAISISFEPQAEIETFL